MFVNPAVVPRIRASNGTTLAHYLRLIWQDGNLEQIDEIWVDPDGEIRKVEEPEILSL